MKNRVLQIFGCFLLSAGLAACQADSFDLGDLEMTEETAIFGGRKIEPQEHLARVLVGIRFEDANHQMQTCTGSWIAPRWIITAAHCIPASTDKMKIYQTTSLENSEKLKPLEVLQMIVHPEAQAEKERLAKEKKYDLGNRYDVALVEVKESSDYFFVFNADKEFIPSLLHVAGFGAESYDVYSGATGEKVLQTASLIPSETQPQEGILFINQKGDTGVCLGDSGSPLFEKSEIGDTLKGVASSVRNAGSASVCQGESRFVLLAPLKEWIARSLILKN